MATGTRSWITEIHVQPWGVTKNDGTVRFAVGAECHVPNRPPMNQRGVSSSATNRLLSSGPT